MTDQYDEQEDIDQGEDAPIGSDRVTREALRIAQEQADQQAKVAHQELVADFANEITALRVAGKATPQALAAIREKYAARGMGHLISDLTPQSVANALLQAARNVSSRDLTESYRNDMLAAQGKPDQVRRIKESYRAKGVDVDRVKLFGGA